MQLNGLLSGKRFSSTAFLSQSSITAFARAAGDSNPIHYDEAFARQTSFRTIIASGAQTSSLLMSATADYFSKISPMVGLEFSMKFKRPVFANEHVLIEWLIVQVKENERLRGSIVSLYGRMKKENGETALGAKGKVLLKVSL